MSSSTALTVVKNGDRTSDNTSSDITFDQIPGLDYFINYALVDKMAAPEYEQLLGYYRRSKLLRQQAVTTPLTTGTTLRPFNSEEDSFMDWQEKYIDKLDRDIGEIKTSFSDTEKRIGDTVDRAVNQMNQNVSQVLGELREKDNQRHTEFLHIQTAMTQLGDTLDTKLDETNKHVNNISIATIIGIASIVVGFIAALIARG